MANILGIACYNKHVSSAALLREGRIAAAVDESRFSRRKHTDCFPSQSINFCLEKAGIGFSDIDYIGYFNDPWICLTKKFSLFLRYFPDSLRFYFANRSRALVDRWAVRGELNRAVGRGNEKKIRYIEHHMAHAASCFLVSPYDQAAILTVDGRGEYHTTWLGYGRGNRIFPLRKVPLHHSLGLLYSTITSYLGFEPLSGEGKVMGLAAYGKPVYYSVFENIIKILPEGRFSLDIGYFDFAKSGLELESRANFLSGKFFDIFGPAREEGDEVNERHANIAASLQKRIEDVMVHMAEFLYGRLKVPNLCLAGGVALNSVANGVLKERTRFRNIFVQPAADDVGTALGCACFIDNILLGNPRKFVMEHDFLGPEFTDSDYQEALRACGKQGKYVDDIERKAAQLLAQGLIVGWFQGRMEFGPRALGNRSILADPRDAGMKDKINKCVKHRESFRPFAPAVLEERAAEFFDCSYSSPFMLFVHRVKEDKIKSIPAVVHVDGTARTQTVSKSINPRFWRLISEFGKITGIPLVLNTSFNDNEEPIVCSPFDALQCFESTGIDCLVMGNYLIGI